MLAFKPVELSDKPLLQPFLYQHQKLLCNWSFPNMILWHDAYLPHYTFVNDMLFVSALKNKPVYGFPIGEGDIQSAINTLIEHTKKHNHILTLAFLTDEMRETLESLFPNQFSFEEDRGTFDYIYNVNDLLHLKGKKYQSKRNHINQFKKKYDYTYHPLTVKDIPECLEMQNQWYNENNCSTDTCSLELENCAVKRGLGFFGQMDMKGGVLRVNNKIIAFTLGQALNKDVFEVNIEKAFKDYHGAYAMINQLFVEAEMQNYQYINREEDVGEASIRKAKLSYYPTIILKKHKATLK